MGDKTKIEWTDASWNPIRARDRFTGQTGWFCEILTPGCENCYAAAINYRLGTGGRYLRKDRDKYDTYLDENTLIKPLHWKKPRMIFVCSMTDLFAEWVTDRMLDQIFATMALTARHTYQVLTKRADRMRDYLSRRHDILPNVWVGVSVEDQRRADERIPLLLETPAAVRWLSAEPLLGPIDLMNIYHSPGDTFNCLDDGADDGVCPEPILNWVVIGGESGPNSRPFNIQWARSIIRQCREASIPVFMKQLGSYIYNWPGNPELSLVSQNRIHLRNHKGGDTAEWPEDLRVRKYPH